MEYQPAARLKSGPSSRACPPRVDKHQPIIIQNIELLTPNQIKLKRRSLSTANLFLSAAALSRQGRQRADSPTRPQSLHDNHFSSNISTTSIQTWDSESSSEPLLAKGAVLKFRKHVTFADVSTDTKLDDLNFCNNNENLGHGSFTECSGTQAVIRAPKIMTDETNEAASESRFSVISHSVNSNTICDTNKLSNVSQPVNHTGYNSQTKNLHKHNFPDHFPIQKYPNVIALEKHQEQSGSLQERPDKQNVTNTRRDVTLGHSDFGDREVTLEGDKTCSLYDHQDLPEPTSLKSELLDYENDVTNKGGQSELWYEREKSEFRTLFQSSEVPKPQNEGIFFRSKSTEPPVSHWATSLNRHLSPTTTAIKSNSDVSSDLTTPRKVIKVNFLKEECQDRQRPDYLRFRKKSISLDGDNSYFPGNENNVISAVRNSDVVAGYPTNQSNKTDNVSVPLVSNTKISLKTLNALTNQKPEDFERSKSQGEHNADFLMQQYSASGEKQANPRSVGDLGETPILTLSKHKDSDGKSLKSENAISKISSSRIYPLNSPRARDKERRLLSALPVRATGARVRSSTRSVKDEEPLDKLLSAERFLLSLDKKMSERTWMNRRLEQLVINSTKFGGRSSLIHERSRTTLS